MNKTYTDEQIRNFLINNVKQSIINDVGGAFKGWSQQIQEKGHIAGFYAVPRMIFPEIDGLGSYMTGKPRSTGLNIKTYLSEVMGMKNPRYKEFAALIVVVYRHGLLHQHEPKWFSYRNRAIGLQFTISNLNNPRNAQNNNHLNFDGKVLSFDVNTFYYDVRDSIDEFANEVITRFRDTFEKSIREQSKPISKTDILYRRKNKYISDEDFNFLKKRKIV